MRRPRPQLLLRIARPWRSTWYRPALLDGSGSTRRVARANPPTDPQGIWGVERMRANRPRQGINWSANRSGRGAAAGADQLAEGAVTPAFDAPGARLALRVAVLGRGQLTAAVVPGPSPGAPQAISIALHETK